MRFSEMEQVVGPVLRALNAHGFVVIDSAGKPGWAEVLRILEQYPRTPGVVWRQNVGAMEIGGRGMLRAGGFAYMKGERRFVRFGGPGLADISGVLRDGRRIEIECKRPGQKLSREQDGFKVAMLRLGAICLTVHSADEVLAFLDDLSLCGGEVNDVS